MAIQIQFNSVQFDYEELKAHYPELAMMIQSSLPKKKKSKRRKRKKKITVACLIDDIKENLK
jgi:hypothetical protein